MPERRLLDVRAERVADAGPTLPDFFVRSFSFALSGARGWVCFVLRVERVAEAGPELVPAEDTGLLLRLADTGGGDV